MAEIGDILNYQVGDIIPGTEFQSVPYVDPATTEIFGESQQTPSTRATFRRAYLPELDLEFMLPCEIGEGDEVGKIVSPYSMFHHGVEGDEVRLKDFRLGVATNENLPHMSKYFSLGLTPDPSMETNILHFCRVLQDGQEGRPNEIFDYAVRVNPDEQSIDYVAMAYSYYEGGGNNWTKVLVRVERNKESEINSRMELIQSGSKECSFEFNVDYKDDDFASVSMEASGREGLSVLGRMPSSELKLEVPLYSIMKSLFEMFKTDDPDTQSLRDLSLIRQ